MHRSGNRVALSTDGLPNGVYFCRLRYGTISRVGQLVVQNRPTLCKQKGAARN